MKAAHPDALGRTHVSDGMILPFADVDCDRISEFVQKDLMFFHTSRGAKGFSGARWRAC